MNRTGLMLGRLAALAAAIAVLSLPPALPRAQAGGMSGRTSVSPPSGTPQQFSPTIRKRLTAALASEMRRFHVPGAIVGIWIPGRGQWLAARGTADLSTGAPERLDNHFRIGSVTKTFTVTAILQLADEGRLSLDDPVSRYLPGVPNGAHITIRELANMTSGFFNYSEAGAFGRALFANPFVYWKPGRMLHIAFQHRPYFAPGKGQHYSNTNTILLGLIIQRVTHGTVNAFFRRHIFGPLHLNQTSMPNTGALPAPYAHGYITLDGRLTDATGWNPSWGWTAGAMYSTLDDLHRWAIALGRGTLLSRRMQRQRLQFVSTKPGTPGIYGLGIFNLHGWLGHNGSLPGYQTFCGYLPARHAVLIVNTNTDDTVHGRSPANTIAEVLGGIVTPSHRPALPPH